MSREVAHDGAGSFLIRFPFDRRLVELLKSLPRRRWQAVDKVWSVPDDDVVLLVDLLQPEGFAPMRLGPPLACAPGLCHPVRYGPRAFLTSGFRKAQNTPSR